MNMLSNYAGVKGIVVVNNDGIVIRHTLEDPKVSVQYAALITVLTQKARSTIQNLDPAVSTPSFCTNGLIVVQDSMNLLRIRSKKHEIIVAPGEPHLCSEMRPCTQQCTASHDLL